MSSHGVVHPLKPAEFQLGVIQTREHNLADQLTIHDFEEGFDFTTGLGVVGPANNQLDVVCLTELTEGFSDELPSVINI
jgi:hypothetical protein